MRSAELLKLKKNDSCLIQDLRSSIEKIGGLYPVLEDSYGNIIDGRHRLEADSEWPRRRLENVKTEKERILARLVSNACRRNMPSQEKREMLAKLGGVLLQDGLQRGEISKNISEESGMSYQWVMKYLPSEFKNRSQSERATAPVRCAAKISRLAGLREPHEGNLISINRYSNMHWAVYTVKMTLHEKIERAARILMTTPQILVQNIIEERLREIIALDQEDAKVLEIIN